MSTDTISCQNLACKMHVQRFIKEKETLKEQLKKAEEEKETFKKQLKKAEAIKSAFEERLVKLEEENDVLFASVELLEGKLGAGESSAPGADSVAAIDPFAASPPTPTPQVGDLFDRPGPSRSDSNKRSFRSDEVEAAEERARLDVEHVNPKQLRKWIKETRKTGPAPLAGQKPHASTLPRRNQVRLPLNPPERPRIDTGRTTPLPLKSGTQSQMGQSGQQTAKVVAQAQSGRPAIQTPVDRPTASPTFQMSLPSLRTDYHQGLARQQPESKYRGSEAIARGFEAHARGSLEDSKHAPPHWGLISPIANNLPATSHRRGREGYRAGYCARNRGGNRGRGIGIHYHDPERGSEFTHLEDQREAERTTEQADQGITAVKNQMKRQMEDGEQANEKARRFRLQ